MLYLIIGLAIFFSIHLVRTLAPQWREAGLASMGEGTWKGLFSVVSLVGMVVFIWGFGQALTEAPVLYTPPDWGSHVAFLLMAVAGILMVAGNLPAGRIKQAVKHPFLASVTIWALAHLLVNGDLASAVLFGSFLVYSVWNRVTLERRGDPDPVAVSSTSDIIAIVFGLILWVLLIYWLHEWLFGVNPAYWLDGWPF